MTKLEQSSHIAQVVMGAGVIVSMFLSCQALRETQRDRESRQVELERLIAADADLQAKQQRFEQQPNVLFQHTVCKIDVTLLDNGSVDIARKEVDGSAPQIRNFGRGPAVDIKVHWQPKRITPEDVEAAHPELFKETIVFAVPSALAPDQLGNVYGLPACFAAPIAQRIKSVSGDVTIRFTAADGRSETVLQTFSADLNLEDRTMMLFFQPIPPFNFSRDLLGAAPAPHPSPKANHHQKI